MEAILTDNNLDLNPCETAVIHILGSIGLRQNRRLSEYQVRTSLEREFGCTSIQASIGLRKLENAKLVEATESEPEPGGASEVFYSLTAQGIDWVLAHEHTLVKNDEGK
jgi:DNA-binding PadR family transcriptional regulator